MSEAEEMPYYPSGGNNTHANYIVELTNPDISIEHLELSLKGKKINSNGELVDCGKRLINDKGINSIISQVRSVVNQISILSFLDDKDIRMELMLFSESLIKDLMVNRKNYEINCPSDRTKILTMCQCVAYNTLRRALKGNDKNFWSRVMMMFSTDTNAKNSEGLLSKYNILKNR